MPVGAIIGGVASIGGALLSSSSNNKAINRSTDAQLAATQEALQYQREARGDNKAVLDPYVQSGYRANSNLNALLGLNENQSPQAPQAGYAPQNNALSPQAFSGFNPQYLNGDFPAPIAFNGVQGRFNPVGASGFGFQNAPQNNALLPQQTSQPDAEGAFQTFLDSTPYQFELSEGLDAVNSGFAGAGALQSGAAMKGISDYTTNKARGSIYNYMGLLGQQSGQGLSAGNALAGVTTNFANNAAGLAQQNGQNIANAAVAKANNKNALYGGIASGIGTILGGL